MYTGTKVSEKQAGNKINFAQQLNYLKMSSKNSL